MHRFEVVIGLLGLGTWLLAQVIITIVVCALLAIPFAVLFVFDALADPRRARPPLLLVPPSPPRRPVAAPLPTRRAA